MNSIKQALSGFTQRLRGEGLSGSASVAKAVGYEAGEKFSKAGHMAGRTVMQLKEGVSSALNAFKQGLQGVKDNMAKTPGYTSGEMNKQGVDPNVQESLKRSGLV